MAWKPMLNRERDLPGATPRTLALALLGRKPKDLPRPARQPVVRDKVAVEKVTSDKTGNRVAHLSDGA